MTRTALVGEVIIDGRHGRELAADNGSVRGRDRYLPPVSGSHEVAGPNLAYAWPIGGEDPGLATGGRGVGAQPGRRSVGLGSSQDGAEPP